MDNAIDQTPVDSEANVDALRYNPVTNSIIFTEGVRLTNLGINIRLKVKTLGRAQYNDIVHLLHKVEKRESLTRTEKRRLSKLIYFQAWDYVNNRSVLIVP